MKEKKGNQLSPEGKQAESALKRAVAKVVAEHRLRGTPLWVWQNNRLVKVF